MLCMTICVLVRIIPIITIWVYLPPVWKHNNQHPASVHKRLLKQYKACGRILAKCLLEGIHIPVSFSAALHCMLVGDELLSSSADECIAMLADFDPEEA